MPNFSLNALEKYFSLPKPTLDATSFTLPSWFLRIDIALISQIGTVPGRIYNDHNGLIGRLPAAFPIAALHLKFVATRREVGKVGEADAARFYPVCFQPNQPVAVPVLRRICKIKRGKLERQIILVVIQV